MNRLKWIDVSKGIAILLVVFGHILRAGIVHMAVYAFHVPCFFFLAGITTKEELTVKSICIEARRILIPYYSFGILSIAAYSILGSFAAASLNMDASSSVWQNIGKLIYGASIQEYNAPLWFLPALFAIKIWYKVLWRWLKGNRKALVLFAMTGSVLGFWYTGMGWISLPCSFELVLKVFPFFLAGKLLAPMLIDIGAVPNIRVRCMILGVVILVVTCVLGVIAPPVNYTNNQLPNPYAFYLIATLGCVGTYCLSVGLQDVAWMNNLGKNTLPILVMHKFPIVFFQICDPFKQFLQVPDSLKGVFFGAVPVAAITIAVCLAAGYVIKKACPLIIGMPKKPVVQAQ